MSRLTNQTYCEWYEFDVNFELKVNVAVSMNESKYVVKIQYCWLTYNQNLMINDDVMKKRFIADLWMSECMIFAIEKNFLEP